MKFIALYVVAMLVGISAASVADTIAKNRAVSGQPIITNPIAPDGRRSQG